MSDKHEEEALPAGVRAAACEAFVTGVAWDLGGGAEQAVEHGAPLRHEKASVQRSAG